MTSKDTQGRGARGAAEADRRFGPPKAPARPPAGQPDRPSPATQRNGEHS